MRKIFIYSLTTRRNSILKKGRKGVEREERKKEGKKERGREGREEGREKGRNS